MIYSGVRRKLGITQKFKEMKHNLRRSVDKRSSNTAFKQLLSFLLYKLIAVGPLRERRAGGELISLVDCASPAFGSSPLISPAVFFRALSGLITGLWSGGVEKDTFHPPCLSFDMQICTRMGLV